MNIAKTHRVLFSLSHFRCVTATPNTPYRQHTLPPMPNTPYRFFDLMRNKQVGDYVELIRGKTYKGLLVGKPGIALLGIGSIEPGGGFREDHYKTYGGDCPAGTELYPGDLYVSLKGATKDGSMVGSIARVPPHIPMGRLTQDTVKLVFQEPSTSVKSYLYWLLRTPYYRDYCARRVTGSSVAALSRQDFLDYPVPPLTSYRQSLVSVLEAIETKIENLRKQNETLEAIAQTLFKRWFIDFEFPYDFAQGKPSPDGQPYKSSGGAMQPSELGDIPEGWRVGELSDIAKNIRDGIKQESIDTEMSYIALEHMPRKSIALDTWSSAIDIASNKFRFQDGQILFGKLRPYFHKVGVSFTAGICSTDILVLDSKVEVFFYYLLMNVSSDAFIQYVTLASEGTRMPRTSWDYMKKFEILIPDTRSLGIFNRLISSFIQRIKLNVYESKNLTKTRDTLLPKLMNGQLRITP
jgi:type I restriction enzyme S subunit